MSTPYQSRFGPIGRDSVGFIVQESYDEMHDEHDPRSGSASAVSVAPSEPVTPPSSANPGSIYAMKPAFPKSYQQHTKGATSQSLPSGGTLAAYTYGSGALASPMETPTGTPYASQQGYISTPFTPGSASASSSSSTSGSVTGAPMTPMFLGSSRYSFVHGTPIGVPPGGHNRSYSYSPADVQPSLQRLSVSGASGPPASTPSMGSIRPRAYSSTGTPAATFSGSPTAVGNPSSEGSSYIFPAPLSSPVSPGHAAQAGAHIAQRSFPQVFMRTLSEEQLSSTHPGPLRRTLSTVSTNSTSIHESAEEAVVENSDSLPGIRRGSPPFFGRYYHPRRSSSSGSSIMDPIATAPPPAAAMASGSGAGATTAGSPPNSATAIDIASATDAQIYALCKDQRGCRFLQRKLSEHDPVVVRRVFASTYPHIVTLMMDPFGNYFCQKLFDHCSPDEVTTLMSVAALSLPEIAINQHGTRALQKLVDAITLQEQVDIVIQALDGSVVRLIRDLNGNHVVQKLLLNLNETGAQFIYDAMCESVVEVGSHRHGCCVLQRCLDHAQDYNRHRLVAHIVAQSLALVCDPFGNYVCQYVIDLNVPEYTNSLVEQLLGKIAILSVQKFSSNVVEKCLRSASPPLQRAMVLEIMVPRTLHDLLLDNYGNYVIQTALESTGATDPSMKQQLAASVQSALATTRSPYGRRIMSKLKA